MNKRVFIFVTLFWLLLMCFALTAYAAPVPEGFVGVPWGSSRDQVIKIMSERGWREAYHDGKTYYGSFAGFPEGLIIFGYTGNVMTSGSAELQRATSGYQSRQVFDDAYKLISEKYGPAEINSMKNSDRTSSMPVLYWTKWQIVDDVSSDRYEITLGTSDSIYWVTNDGKSTRMYIVRM
jgi:hypothetical protein